MKTDKLVEKIPKAVIDMLHRYHNDQTGDLPLREAFIEIYEAGRKAEREEGISDINCCEETDCEFYPETLRRLEQAKQEGWNKCIEECCQECQIRLNQKPPTKVRSKGL